MSGSVSRCVAFVIRGWVAGLLLPLLVIGAGAQAQGLALFAVTSSGLELRTDATRCPPRTNPIHVHYAGQRTGQVDAEAPEFREVANEILEAAGQQCPGFETIVLHGYWNGEKVLSGSILRFGSDVRVTASSARPATSARQPSNPAFAMLPQVIGPFFQAIYDGRYADADAALRSAGQTVAGGGVFGAAAGAMLAANKGRDILAQYIVARAGIDGLCGAAGTRFDVSVQTVTNFYNGLGGFNSSVAGPSRVVDGFVVPRRLSAIVASTPEANLNPPYIGAMGRFIRRNGGCDSPFLDRFEDNVVAFWNG